MSDNKIKVVIPPEVLEQMQRDIPADELQELLEQISQMAEDGSIFEEAEPLDLEQLKLTDPEEYAALMQAVNSLGHETIDEMLEEAPVERRTLN